MQNDKEEMDVSDCQPGICFIRIKENGVLVKIEKIVILR